MSSTLKNHTPQQIHNILLEGQRYNRVRLALRRLGAPIRLSIPGLRRVDMLIEEDAWIAVDSAHSDRPLLAIRDFQTAGRCALFAPMPCRVYEYSAGAGEKYEYLLHVTVRLLEVRLSNCRGPVPSRRVSSLIPHPPR